MHWTKIEKKCRNYKYIYHLTKTQIIVVKWPSVKRSWQTTSDTKSFSLNCLLQSGRRPTGPRTRTIKAILRWKESTSSWRPKIICLMMWKCVGDRFEHQGFLGRWGDTLHRRLQPVPNSEKYTVRKEPDAAMQQYQLNLKFYWCINTW